MLSRRRVRSLWFLCFLVLFVVCVLQISRLQRFSKSNDGARTRLRRAIIYTPFYETAMPPTPHVTNILHTIPTPYHISLTSDTTIPTSDTTIPTSHTTIPTSHTTIPTSYTPTTTTPIRAPTSASPKFKSGSPILLCLTSIIIVLAFSLCPRSVWWT